MKKTIRMGTLAALAATAIATAVPGGASAQTSSGWTGPTPPVGGVLYLHNSTISTDTPGKVIASSKIWTVTGVTVPVGTIGVRARMFKSGALCELTTFQYNWNSTGSFTGKTPGVGCGSGGYNSHGFVAVRDPQSGANEFVTFPTNSIGFTAPTAAQQAVDDRAAGRNGRGKTFGPAKSEGSQPDLVLAVNREGKTGYIESSELTRAPLTVDRVKALPTTVGADGARVYAEPSRNVPLLDREGNRIGTFHVAGA